MRTLRAAVWLFAGVVLCAGCVPSPGPFVLPEVEGRVVDRDTGEPIAGAEVIEWWRGAGSGGKQPHYHARWVTTGASGHFTLSRQMSPSLRMWLLRTYEPRYSFYHPDYGLEHGGGIPERGELVLSGSRSVAAQRRAELPAICRGERQDPGARHLASLACADLPSEGQAPR